MHIVILGNGIAGITAARFVRKLSDHQITVVSGESDYFYSRTALMYIYMGHMRQEDTQPYEPWFWEKNAINLKRAWIKRIDFDQQTLEADSGERIHYDKLLLATGSESNKFGWPGQDLKRVQGLVSLQDLQGMEDASADLQRAVIVGGGLIGIEMGEMFHTRDIPVTFLVREHNYWSNALPPEESEMVSRHIREHGFDLRLNTELSEIIDDGAGGVGAIKTKDGERIECGFVGLTAGVHPNLDLVKDSALETNRGILVDEYLRTNIPNVFAAGDCSEQREPKPGRRGVEAIWYTGRMAGEVAAYNMCEHPVPYDPGIFFNSAKFLDIEYQVYGPPRSRLPEGQQTLYWEHEKGRKSIRLDYDRQTGTISGFTLMGVRYRHEVCEKWLSEGFHVEDVLQNLGIANFDPELYEQYERAVLQQYNQQTGKQLQLKRRRGLGNAIRFLRKQVTV